MAADGQTETQRFIKIHAGIFGVAFILSGLLVLACSVAAFASQHNTILYTYPVYGCGFIFGIIGCVPWLEFQCRWTIFFILLLIATLVVMGTAPKHSSMEGGKVKALMIVSIVGTGIVLFLTCVWAVLFSKHHGLFGLKVTSPDKATLLVSFKIHSAVFYLIGLHQLAWALVAFAVKGFDVPDEAIRIVAFCLGGFFNSLLAFLAGVVCSQTVSYLTKKKKDWRIKAKSLIMVHRTWTLLFLAFCIAGVALFGNCFRTISKRNELGEWESNALIVASYIFSLVGNVLLGFQFLALTVLEKECTVFGIDVDSKTTPSTPPPNPTPPASSNRSTTTNTTTTAQSGTATTTVSTSTTSSAVTNATRTATIASISGNTASTSATNGASGGNTTDIEEIKERNRLLQEQIELEKQLNELRSQWVSRPEDYPPLYVREAPEVAIPAPPSYDELEKY